MSEAVNLQNQAFLHDRRAPYIKMQPNMLVTDLDISATKFTPSEYILFKKNNSSTMDLFKALAKKTDKQLYDIPYLDFWYVAFFIRSITFANKRNAFSLDCDKCSANSVMLLDWANIPMPKIELSSSWTEELVTQQGEKKLFTFGYMSAYDAAILIDSDDILKLVAAHLKALGETNLEEMHLNGRVDLIDQFMEVDDVLAIYDKIKTGYSYDELAIAKWKCPECDESQEVVLYGHDNFLSPALIKHI